MERGSDPCHVARPTTEGEIIASVQRRRAALAEATTAAHHETLCAPLVPIAYDTVLDEGLKAVDVFPPQSDIL